MSGAAPPPVPMSARICREAVARAERLARALEQIRDLPGKGQGQADLMRSTAAAALEEKP